MSTKTSFTGQNESNVIFYDDFTEDVLDPSNWNVEVTGCMVNIEQQAYIDSVETIYIEKDWEQANGVLVIHPHYRQGYLTPQVKTFDFISGRINTRGKLEFTYDNVSARILLPVRVGLWTAIWMLGSSGTWPTCGELDIMEYIGMKDWTSAVIHGPDYFGEPSLVNKNFFSHPSTAYEGHIYSMDWTETRILFKVDGELINRATRPMIDFYGPWVFDQKHFLILNCALEAMTPIKTNGISEPYYGLADETVHAFQSNEIKFLVDWVKVSN